MFATPAWAASRHRLGVPVADTSSHRRPGTPTRTTDREWFAVGLACADDGRLPGNIATTDARRLAAVAQGRRLADRVCRRADP